MFMDTSKNLELYNRMCKELNIDNIIELAKQHQISSHITIGGNGLMDLRYYDEYHVSSILLREDYIRYCGFPLLDNDIITDISYVLKDKKVLEIACGSGALAKCLQDKDINVIATDNGRWDHYFNKNNTWTDIEFIDLKDAIMKYGNDIDVILMSWPTKEVASNMIDAIQCLGKEDLYLCYLGELEGGCCAGYDFFDSGMFNFYDGIIYGKDGECNYKRWPGMNDMACISTISIIDK